MNGPTAFAAALSALTALAFPPAAFAQASPAPDGEALRAIQANFQHMTPPPRTVSTINQELRQDRPAAVARAGGRTRGRRHGSDPARDSHDAPASQDAATGASPDQQPKPSASGSGN